VFAAAPYIKLGRLDRRIGSTAMCLALGCRLALIVPIVIAVSSPAFSQEQEQPPTAGDRAAAAGAETSSPSNIPSSPPEVLTGKERLGEKWKDEQRIDNCNVPPDKRGPKPRPDTCPSAPAG
jgi:hypothetical protein